MTLEAKFSGIFRVLLVPHLVQHLDPSDPYKALEAQSNGVPKVVLCYCRPAPMLIPPGPEVFSVGNQKRFFFSAAMLWGWFILST